MVAVMAKYSPLAEKAGMRKIVEQPPHGDALKIAEILKNLGLIVELLGSENYNIRKLRGLNLDD